MAMAADQVPVNKITAEASKLWSPGKLAVDRHGLIYIVDGYKNCVREFDRKGTYKKQIPVQSPSAVAVAASGSVYIGSHHQYAVSIHKHGEIIGYLGARKNEFLSIADIAVDESTGDVYVVDTKAHQVKVYYPSGIPKGALSAAMHLPVAVFVTNSSVYVLDTENVPCDQTQAAGGADAQAAVTNSACTVARIAVLDKKGTLVRSIVGSDDNLLNRPLDIVVDRFDNVYAADVSRKAILAFDRLGVFIGAMTSDLDELRFPVALSVSPDDNILVSSSDTHSIVEIGLSGSLQSGSNSTLAFKSTTGAPVPLSAIRY
jgi:sugar lactone lactonase YvrE